MEVCTYILQSSFHGVDDVGFLVADICWSYFAGPFYWCLPNFLLTFMYAGTLNLSYFSLKWSEVKLSSLSSLIIDFSESELVFIITTSLGYGFSSVSFLLHDMQILSLLSNKIFLHALRNGWDKTIFGLVSVECSAEMQISFFCVSCKGHSRNGPGSYHLFSFSESI